MVTYIHILWYHPVSPLRLWNGGRPWFHLLHSIIRVDYIVVKRFKVVTQNNLHLQLVYLCSKTKLTTLAKDHLNCLEPAGLSQLLLYIDKILEGSN